jgi:predicted oxidoreductase (fatty acid repression mutant protein)
VWAQQSNGMLQYNVWNLLEVAGLGASIQHYNPLIDDEVRRTWGLPDSWGLVAQMPFGAITELPAVKDSVPAAERMRSFK